MRLVGTSSDSCSIESLLLAFVAGAAGLLLSIAGIRWFDMETQDIGKPYWMVFTMDWRTFGFLLFVCIATGIVFGLAPAIIVSKTNVHEMLKEGGRTGSGGIRARRWTSTLMIAQLALTLALLAGAGFMMRSFLTLYRMDIGVDTSRLLSMNMILSARKYPGLDDRTRFLRRLDEHFLVDQRHRSSFHDDEPAVWRRGRPTVGNRRKGRSSRRAATAGHDAQHWIAIFRHDRPAAVAGPRSSRRRHRIRAP